MTVLMIILVITLCLVSFIGGKLYAISRLYNRVYGSKTHILPLINAYDDYFDIFADYAKLGHSIIDDDLK